uniref:Bromo domain-containing protein n=1 Tax=Ditylum brightwellii TaxID=49249 RepID=A0A7S2EII2_9STRA
MDNKNKKEAAQQPSKSSSSSSSNTKSKKIPSKKETSSTTNNNSYEKKRPSTTSPKPPSPPPPSKLSTTKTTNTNTSLSSTTTSPLTLPPMTSPPPPSTALPIPTATPLPPRPPILNQPTPPPILVPPVVTKVSTVEMTSHLRGSCFKVMSALKRRQAKGAKWFLKPVSDNRLIQDYRAKIPSPIDLGTMTTKLEKNEYPTCALFVLDLRRIFGNCLRYNTSINDSFRSVATEMISYTEDYLKYFVEPNTNGLLAYPRLLYCWKLCLSILDELISMTNPSDGHQTVHYFLHPVSFYCGGEFPPGYVDKVKTPMDLGTVTSKLIEGIYQSVGAFVADCRRVVENCKSFYGGRDDGASFVEQAVRLQESMAQQLGALLRYDKELGVKAQVVALTTKIITIEKPKQEFLMGILNDLRNAKYTDRYTKLTESATAPFEKPVNVALFPDYPKFVNSPMDLETIEQNIQNDLYRTPEDFEYDISLIFRNCERYNIPKKNDHIVALAKHSARMFRRLFSARIKAMENGVASAVSSGNDSNIASDTNETESGNAAANPKKKIEVEKKGGAKRSISPTRGRSEGEKPTKKAKTESGANSKVRTSGDLSTSGKKLSNSKSSKSGSAGGGGGSKKKIVSNHSSTPKAPANDGPVPLHVAISQVKDNFPTRRPHKLLEPWEGACSRFFRELMRHPWISAARPRFIFHVPVPVIFPELKDAYAAKIETPMDLTTSEAKLLAGGIYKEAQDFVDDVALVFANAITFNQAGHDEGEPMSCAYYDASRHLLKYTRWLSLEYLSPYLLDDAQDSAALKIEGPASTWKLTTSNKECARSELKECVMAEQIEKTEEGDRFNWMESECEKLLKALRLQSDLRYMTYFIQPNYPADYFAYISKPMDWERCHKNLQQRSYEKFGDLVEDLRLIFSNALKYNARAKGTDTVSGHAYEAAIYMSKKLETAVDKMLLAVSERLGREKIEVIAAEREHEAAERAEEEKIRAAWQKEREKARASTVEVKTRVETVETVKVVQRRAPQRKEMMDFEFPFYDEDEGHHEQSHMEALRQAKILFESQQKERKRMRKMTHTLAVNIFARMIEQAHALEWAKEMENKRVMKAAKDKEVTMNDGKEIDLGHITTIPEPTKVLKEIHDKGRDQIKVSLCKRKSSKKRKRPPCILA